MYKRILVPVDLEAVHSAIGSMSVAKHLCELCGAKLTVVSLVPESGARPAFQSKLETFLESQRSPYVSSIKGELRTGRAIGDGIVQAAKDLQADLIVMATHDPTAPGAEMGSNAAHVLTHTPCSVLSVR